MFALLLLLTEEAPKCTSAVQHCCSGALHSRECCRGKPLVKGKSRGSCAQFCSVCMVLTSFGSPDLPISSYFSPSHRAELGRSLPSVPPAEFGLCDVWCPIGSYEVTPAGTRCWLSFVAFFSFLQMRADRFGFVSNQSCHTVRFQCWLALLVLWCVLELHIPINFLWPCTRGR